MRVLLVADMRDPHAIGWARGLLSSGVDVHAVSSRRLGTAGRKLPHEVRDVIRAEAGDPISRLRAGVTRTEPLLQVARTLNDRGGPSVASGRPAAEGTGRFELPLELVAAQATARTIGRLARRLRPDIVHALRIPFEGVATAQATLQTPFVVSLWGQDLIRQAPGSLKLGEVTRATLRRAAGIHVDCARDRRLALSWGADPATPTLLAPGNFGVDTKLFRAGVPRGGRNLVVMPRGTSPYVNWRAFLKVAHRLHDRHPDITFVGVRLAGVPAAEEAKRRLAAPDRLVLTPDLGRAELADYLAAAIAVVSPSRGDGTPNSVLEGMASGAVPVVGDIESLRDLLGPASLAGGLVNPEDVDALTAAVHRVISAETPDWSRASRDAAAVAVDGWSRQSATPRIMQWYEEVCDGG